MATFSKPQTQELILRQTKTKIAVASPDDTGTPRTNKDVTLLDLNGDIRRFGVVKSILKGDCIAGIVACRVFRYG